MEGQFFTLMNQTRAANGRAPLAWNGCLAAIARGWSASMAANGVLQHHVPLQAVLNAGAPSWSNGGENVGEGGDIGTLNSAFVASPEHFANITGNFNQVGIGVVVSGSTIWVTFDFALA